MAEVKRGLSLLMGVIVYGSILYYGLELQTYLSRLTADTYDGRLSITFSSLFPFFYGSLLAIPHLVRCYRKLGKWTFDILKILLISLPAFLAPMLTILSFLTPVGQTLAGNRLAVFLFNVGYLRANMIVGVIGGYVLCTSISKYKTE